jgi:hypothetical protein
VSLPPANWYADPSDPAMVRYWDGAAWTDHTQAGPQQAFQPTQQPLAPAPTSQGEGYDSIGGRVITPAYGHVMTPGVAPEPFAPSTPYREAPRRSAGKLVLTILLAVVAFVGAGAVVRYGLTEIFGPRTEAAAPLAPSAFATEGTIPSGWEMYTSRSGAVKYANDPIWTDLLTPTLEETILAGAGSHPLNTLEMAGYWQTNRSGSEVGDIIQVLASTYLTGTIRPELEVHSFVNGDVKSAGMGDPTILSDEAFTSATGYAGWRETYSVAVGKKTIYAGVIAVTDGRTIVFASCGSADPPSVWEGDLVALANSLVIDGTAEDL